ncbi:MAG: hypothetical protein KGI54_11445 [Pseudomonadota bacterium]|nr:hypothetical protein [Pseudomonadota bacterium]
MALSDAERMKGKKKPIRSIAAKTNVSWGDKQKLEAVQSWLLLGNLALTSRVLGIPEVTLRVWKATEWWKNAVDDIKLQENVQMSSRLKKIVDASLVAVEDRLLNGDWIYDQKSGQMVRKAVGIKDAHKVATDLMDRQAIIEKATKPVTHEEQNDDKLLKLAEKFAAFVTEKIEHKEEPVEVLQDVSDVEIKES